MEEEKKDDLQTQTIQVPVGGSLELLALGDIGLLAWRAAKKAFIEASNTSNNEA
jgi:hypothetical protein